MSLFTGHTRVPEPTVSGPGAKALRIAIDATAEAEVLKGALQSAQTRIDRGLHDHFHHPMIRPEAKAIDVLLDMTNGLVTALTETRERLEQALAQFDGGTT